MSRLLALQAPHSEWITEEELVEIYENLGDQRVRWISHLQLWRHLFERRERNACTLVLHLKLEMLECAEVLGAQPLGHSAFRCKTSELAREWVDRCTRNVRDWREREERAFRRRQAGDSE